MDREVIRSKQNAKVKGWKKLLTKKGRVNTQTYLIEGNHLAMEALKEGASIQQWIMTEKYLDENHSVIQLIEDPSKILIVDSVVAKEISATPSPQGIFAIVDMVNRDEFNWKGSRYLLIDQVQDPGNLGTIIRTADAADFDGIVIGNGSVDVYNDKVIRSTQGSIWHIPIIEMDLKVAIDTLKANNIKVYATALHKDAIAYTDVSDKTQLAIIVGNEGQGVQENIQSIADDLVFIPMPGRAESLNVAIATGILLFYFTS